MCPLLRTWLQRHGSPSPPAAAHLPAMLYCKTPAGLSHQTPGGVFCYLLYVTLGFEAPGATFKSIFHIPHLSEQLSTTIAAAQ